ncbi:MAG: hypothetical protein ABIS07_14235 [Dokdonella sp.]
MSWSALPTFSQKDSMSNASGEFDDASKNAKSPTDWVAAVAATSLAMARSSVDAGIQDLAQRRINA